MLSPRTLLGCGLAAIAASAAIGVPASGAGETNKTPTVIVADDYFAPVDVKVPKGSKVKWVWDDMNTDTHNVVLTNKRPEGVKKGDYRSPSGAVQITYAAKFTVPGKYEFVCTYHKSVMRMNVKVTK